MKHFKAPRRFLRAATTCGAILLTFALAACGPAREPEANLVYLTTITDSAISQINVAFPGRNCHRTGSFKAGTTALITYECTADIYVEFAYVAHDRTIVRRHTFLNQGRANRVTESQLIALVGMPQLEAWMLIDQRDHP